MRFSQRDADADADADAMRLTSGDSEYNYSFANGTVQSLMCGSPNTSVTVNDFVLPPPKCPSPLQLADNGVDCIIACPLPIFDDATQLSIQWAFIAPALIGVVLCAF